jgi:hypothetical protein
MIDATFTLAYIGPDQMLPVASAFAAAMGVVLMFWRFFLNMVTRPFRLVFRGKGAASPGAATAATTMSDPAAVTVAEKQHQN